MAEAGFEPGFSHACLHNRYLVLPPPLNAGDSLSYGFWRLLPWAGLSHPPPATWQLRVPTTTLARRAAALGVEGYFQFQGVLAADCHGSPKLCSPIGGTANKRDFATTQLTPVSPSRFVPSSSEEQNCHLGVGAVA